MPNAPFTWGAQGPLSLQPGTIQLQNNQFLGYNGPKNYIGNSSFEAQVTTGWTLFNTTLTGGLPTGSVSAGAASLALSVTTTNPLAGLASLQVVAASAWAAGAGIISSTFTIDREDQAQILPGGFKYEPISGTSNANWSGTLGSQTFIIAIRDITNSTWVNGGAIPGYNSMKTGVGPGPASFQFQTNALGAGNQYAIAILASQASAGAISLNFDDFVVGPSASLSQGSVVVASYYCSTNQSTSTATPINFDTKEFDSAGAVTTGSGWKFTAPVSGTYLVNAFVVASSSQSNQIFIYKNGSVYKNIGAINNGAGGVYAPNSTTVFLNATESIDIRCNVTTVTMIGGALNSGVTSTLSISLLTAPQVGPAGQVVDFFGTQSSQGITANVTNIGFTSVKDSNAGWNGTQYAVTIAGDYLLSASFIASGAATPQVYLNGSVYQTNGFLVTAQSGNSGGGSMLVVGCKPGDLISLRANASVTVTGGSLGLFLIQGPSAASSSNATVAAKMTTLSSTTVTANTALTFTTIEFDTTNSLSSLNKFTCPSSGLYEISGIFRQAAALSALFYVAKNGSFTATSGNTFGVNFTGAAASGTILLQCNATDTLQFAADTSITLLATGANINILKVG